jgi:hypothetical protein
MKTFFSHFVPKKPEAWPLIKNTVEAVGIDDTHITPFHTSDGYNGAQDKKNSLSLQKMISDEFEKKGETSSIDSDSKLSQSNTAVSTDEKKSDSLRKDSMDLDLAPKEKGSDSLKNSEKEWPIVSTVKYFMRQGSAKAFMRDLTRNTLELFKKSPDLKEGGKNPPLFEIPLLTPKKAVVVLKVASPFQAKPIFEKAKTFNLSEY